MTTQNGSGRATSPEKGTPSPMGDIEAQEQPTRAMLEDRWEGMCTTVRRFSDGGEDISEQHEELHTLIGTFIGGVMRADPDQCAVTEVSGGFLASDCVQLIREHIIRRVDELGVAR